jgi:hypothetical protein
MPEPLAQLKRAAKRKDAAEEEYRKALVEAAKSASFAEIGRTLGMTRAGARQALARITRS